MPRPIAAVILPGLVSGLLAGCSGGPIEPPTPAFYQRLDQTGGSVDPASSLAMLNEYRAKRGAAPLVWDPALARVAAAQASRMAALGRVQSAEEAKLDRALAAEGIAFRTQLSSLTAGYRTFAEAFSGWRELKSHDAVMTDPRVSRIGLATAQAPDSKYRIFWAMVLIEP